MISDKLESVRQRIAKCCEKAGRRPEEVELVCVTKEASIEQIKDVLALGVKALGENRVQELVSKYNVIGDKASWHLVGHLQTNKVKDAVAITSLIHSVDSVRLAKEIDVHAGRISKTQDILIQVNVSGEKSKFGVGPEEAAILIDKIASYANINIKGFMTIAPEAPDPEASRPYFRSLRELKDRLNADLKTNYVVLSMGMSGDFEVAIEEGSTMVRIGRAIR